jgi:hypothetical protein
MMEHVLALNDGNKRSRIFPLMDLDDEILALASKRGNR